MSREISERIRVILKNRGISLEKAGEKLGLSKQGVSWVLNKREDDKWVEKEKEWWGKKLNLKEEVFRNGD